MDYTQERIGKIEQSLERVLAMLENLSKQMEKREEDEDTVRRLLYGNNGTPGLVVRLDRLEQSQERARWVTRAILGAVITLVVGGFYAIMSG